METEMIALQGRSFVVELQSMKYSSGYGWMLASMAGEFVLTGIEEVQDGYGISPIKQRFYFGVVSAEEINVEIKFNLAFCSDVTKVAERYTAKVRIIPSDSESFVAYSENANLKYGYPCGVNDANLKYGYPCGVNNAGFKYGYPCGVNDAGFKYGYPCGIQESSKAITPYGVWYNGDSCDVYEASKAAPPYAVWYSLEKPFRKAEKPFRNEEKPFR